jgi:hypothetical protein
MTASELNPFGKLPLELYSRPEVQAARRAYVRALMSDAAGLLAAAEDCDDADEMVTLALDATAALGRAVAEAMKCSMA